MQRKRYLKSFINGPRGERGVTAVEFALVAPVFFMFVLGIVDLGRLFWVKNLMQYGVGQAARYVMVNPSITATALETYADSEIETMFVGITFTADTPGTDVVGDVTYRTITATYTFSWLMPLVPLDDLPLTATIRTPVNATP